jgi:PTH1 family peptidyl-tRNA hydrolase
VALVLGLGNPGEQYARTRHNAGWRVVELLVARWRAEPAERDAAYRAWRAERPGGVVDLAVPLTYMNLSGEALEAWRARHDFDPAQLLVVTDDVYLPIGTLRLRARGSSGGHRGLESLEAALGGREFARLRIGVGAIESANLRDHVLDAPGADEEQAFEASLTSAADAVECWAEEGILSAMNRYNRRVRKEESAS